MIKQFKKLFFAISLLSIFHFNLAQTSTLTFSEKTNFGDHVSDGEGGSTDVPDITFQISRSGGDITYFLEDNNGFDTDGFNGLGTNNPFSDNFSSLTIESNDGSEFSFDGFTMAELAAEGVTLRVNAYRDNIKIDSSILVGENKTITTFDTRDLPSKTFKNVDKVIINGTSGTSTGMFALFNSFIVSPAVAVIIDTEAPVINTIKNKTGFVNEECKFTLEDYTLTTVVTDNLDPNPRVIQFPSSGTEISTSQLVTITVIDLSYNINQTQFMVNIIDSISPSITDIPNQDLFITENCTAFLPDYTGLVSVADNCDPNPVVTQSPKAGSLLSNSSRITLTVTDTSGNISETKFMANLMDNISPSIADIPNQDLFVTENCTAFLPDYTGLAIVADNCDPNPIVTQNPEVGSLLSSSPLITLTVTDASGNRNETKFMVNLIDNISPSIADISNQDLFVAENCTAFLPDYTSLAVVIDNCDPNPIVTQNPEAGTLLSSSPLITLTATDASGNTSSTQFTTNIFDNTAPNLECQNDTSLNIGTPSIVTYRQPIITDNCLVSNAVLSSGLESGSVFPLGETTITYTAMDLSQNSRECSFTVTVEQVNGLANTINTQQLFYPNPSNGTLSFSGDIPDKIIIRRLNGTFVSELVNIEGSIDLSSLPNAIYLLDVHNQTVIDHHKITVFK